MTAPRRSRRSRTLLLAAAGLLALLAGGCIPEEDRSLPSAEEVSSSYRYRGTLEATIDGDVAVVRAYQPYDQLRRGGELWAKVGPYVLLFSSETRRLFEEHGGLAAVRVITLTPDGREIARATLGRRTLNDVTWRRALNISGKARRDGTERPSLLSDLVRWGEDHTTYEYNESVIPG